MAIERDEGRGTQGSNVIIVPPRRRTITYRGLHGTIEYKPRLKIWQYTIKLIHTTILTGELSTEAEAELEVKKKIELALAGKNKNIRTAD